MQMPVSVEVVVVGQMCNCWGEEKWTQDSELSFIFKLGCC